MFYEALFPFWAFSWIFLIDFLSNNHVLLFLHRFIIYRYFCQNTLFPFLWDYSSFKRILVCFFIERAWILAAELSQLTMNIWVRRLFFFLLQDLSHTFGRLAILDGNNCRKEKKQKRLKLILIRKKFSVLNYIAEQLKETFYLQRKARWITELVWDNKSLHLHSGRKVGASLFILHLPI